MVSSCLFPVFLILYNLTLTGADIFSVNTLTAITNNSIIYIFAAFWSLVYFVYQPFWTYLTVYVRLLPIIHRIWQFSIREGIWWGHLLHWWLHHCSVQFIIAKDNYGNSILKYFPYLKSNIYRIWKVLNRIMKRICMMHI